MKGRALIEGRYGPLGHGAQHLEIKGKTYSARDLLTQMALCFDDTRPIDALAIAEGRYVVRYFDGQDQRVVAQEFDSDFRCLFEARAEPMEWSGGAVVFSYFSGH